MSILEIELNEIAGAGDADRATIQVGVAHRSQQRGVSAEAPPDDGHSIRVGDTLRYSPKRGVGDVRVGQAAPILVSDAKPVPTIAARAAKIHLQDRVSAAREK